ncbi:hydantoinase/oxoprolinase family protein [Marinibacterium profundimaris]|uniref:Methylhydantoinase n=1 Tax=Marinibacterium profundimaris TaxID=1679460 RepID=A0A225NLJ5_9RHOB|nr:hydantoinase/oxoprolinase family protein [Marinibacterium profundimaris]OWU70998.1 methylhydantoinase [Marinibacterium profundimaris]
MWRIGIDSGGTFTDVCLINENGGDVHIWKVSSTPDDPSRGIARSFTEGLERTGAQAAEVAFFGHGTTVATNALIQHRGVKTGIITTAGFRDLIAIARQKRPHLYDMSADKPEELVARNLRIGVPERLRRDGSVEVALDEDALREAVRHLVGQGVEAIAISFLYSFLSDAHERRAAQIVAEEAPGVFLSLSHEIAPEFREYERLSTTTVNAYLGPVMHGYVTALKTRLADAGLRVAPHLTQSNGGVTGFDQAAAMSVRTVLSGPSTGVVAAQALGQLIGIPNLITFDMGGTSSDVALLADGTCRLVAEAEVHGYPLKTPMLDIHTVGAGGGSIAHVDNGGLLKVGPRSAGAHPGPACYGQGTDEPTVTDANVVLQTQNPDALLNGQMPIDRELSLAAVGRLAEQLGLGVMETADGILDIVTANTAKAIRLISVQRGHDPRGYALVAFGGAGPVHAARLAAELNMDRIVIPRTPGVLCALGLLMTDLRTDYATTRIRLLDEVTLDELTGIFDGLTAQAGTWFDHEGIAPEARDTALRVDMRYAGQNYEIAVDLPVGPFGSHSLEALREGFQARHRQLYGFVAEGDAIQMVTWRLTATGAVPKAEMPAFPDAGPDASAAKTGARPVWMREAGGFTDTPIYDRAALRPGNEIAGPAIIDQLDTTTVVPPGMTARVDTYLTLILERDA